MIRGHGQNEFIPENRYDLQLRSLLIRKTCNRDGYLSRLYHTAQIKGISFMRHQLYIWITLAELQYTLCQQ